MPGGDDYVFAGNGLLTIHTVREGGRIIQIPQGSDLYSMDEMRLVTQGAREYRTFLKAQTTYSFYVGTPDEMRKLGLPVERTPAPLRARWRVVPASQTVVEPEAATDVLESEPFSPEVSAPVYGEAVPSTEPQAEAVPAGPEVAPRPRDRRRRRPVKDPHRTSAAGAPASAAPAEPVLSSEPVGEAVVSADGSAAAVESAEHKRRRRRRGGRGRGRRPRPEGGEGGEGGAAGGDAPAE